MKFRQLNYNTTEGNGPLQPAVILSDVLSTSITIQIKDKSNTAIGECTTPSRHNQMCVIFEYASVIIFEAFIYSVRIQLSCQ